MIRATQLVIPATVAMLSAAVLQAQTSSHEIGVDLGVSSTKRDGVDGRVLRVGTPIDVRVGFVTTGPLMLETRFRGSYTRTDDAWTLFLAPGLNVIWRIGKGTGPGGRMGPYLTGGVSLEHGRFRSPVSAGTQSSSQLGVNLGVGTRLGRRTAAFRPELFVHQGFRSRDLGDRGHVPANSTIGLRLGVSLWR